MALLLDCSLLPDPPKGEKSTMRDNYLLKLSQKMSFLFHIVLDRHFIIATKK